MVQSRVEPAYRERGLREMALHMMVGFCSFAWMLTSLGRQRLPDCMTESVNIL